MPVLFKAKEEEMKKELKRPNFDERPKWRGPSIGEGVMVGTIPCTRFSVVIDHSFDKHADRLNFRIQDAMCKAIGAVLAEAGIIKKEEIG